MTTSGQSGAVSLRRRDWYITICLALSVFVLHLAFPRYEWRAAGEFGLLRIDRWTGQTQLGVADREWGRWVSYDELHRDWASKATR